MRLTYSKCAELVGNRETKKIAGNTYIRRFHNSKGEVAYGVEFHHTCILLYSPDGTVKVTSGGYQTATTKSRLNDFGPFQVWQVKGQWRCKVNAVTLPFEDGYVVDVDGTGTAVGFSERAALTDRPEELALVAAFINGDCPAGVVTDWRKENGLLPA